MSDTSPSLPSPDVVLVLDTARSKLGQRETAPNEGPIVTWSMAPWTKRRPDGSAWALWCAAFASRCWLTAWPGFKDIGNPDCDVLWARCAARGWTHLRTRGQVDVPQPGDLLFHGTASDLTHVELVTGFDQGKGIVYTVAGNVGDAVRARKYLLSARSIFGWARPTRSTSP